MALSQTTLTAPITASQLRLPVASVSAYPTVGTVGCRQVVQIDSEFMICVGVPTATQIDVAFRGYDGTVPAAHDILSAVITSPLASDFGVPIGASVVTIDLSEDTPITLGQDQTVALPVTNSVFNINKATAIALVLPAPSIADNGLTLVFTSQTSAAHVLSSPGLVNTGAAGSPFSTLTFGVLKGATATLIAENGAWNLASSTNVTAS